MMPFCCLSKHSNTTSSASLPSRLTLRREVSRELRRPSTDRSRLSNSSRSYRIVKPLRRASNADCEEGPKPQVGAGQASPPGSPDASALLVNTCAHCASLRIAPTPAATSTRAEARSEDRSPEPRVLGRVSTPTPRGQTPSHRRPKSMMSRAVQGGHPISMRPAARRPEGRRVARRSLRARRTGHRLSLGGRQRRPCRSMYPADLRTEVQSSRGSIVCPRTLNSVDIVRSP